MYGKVLVALCGLLIVGSASGQVDLLTVRTEQGKVHGKTINAGKVRAFEGLPYAAAPVGPMRWKAPAAPVKRSGTLEATSFGAHCAQNHVFDDMVFQDAASVTGSEDCLFLNVYTPAGVTDASKLPVMFWIHGGGYSGGSGDEPRQNGDFLPLKGVVLVTINYRLGVFGFLATSGLAQENGGTAGNYALEDMTAALQWVHANIKNFGGDAGNVTIFGESAGSLAVSTLMVSPMSKGLFAKAIGESGSVFIDGLGLDTLQAREAKDDSWAATTGAKSTADLRAMTTAQVLAAAKAPSARFGPAIDGKFLTEPAGVTYAAGRQAHVPMMAGWNKDEASFLGNGMTVAKFQALAATTFKDRAAQFLALYPASTDAEATRSAIDYGSDSFIAFSTWRWIQAQRATGGAPVYRYHFELQATPSKYHPGTFAFHSDDIEYVFGTLDTRPGWTVRPEDRKLSEQMMGYWTNFAKTGNPNGAGLPVWPVDGSPEALIHLDSTVTSGPDLLAPRYAFLSEK